MDIIGHLPIEIAQEIFQYLNGTDLSNCCRVSRIWRNFANSDILWRDICLRKGIICDLEYYNEDCILEPMVDWAQAYMSYVKKRFINWRRGHRLTTTINSCYDTIACCNSDTLVFTNASSVIFVYDMSRRKPFCIQTIHPECMDKEILSLDITRDHLLVRQGDSFAVYLKDRTFKLKGYLLRHEDCYIFTKHYHEMNEGPGYLRYCIIEDGICLLLGKSLFICRLKGYYNVEVHSIGLLDQSFLLHDRFRTYVVTGEKTVTAFDVTLNYEDFNISDHTVLAMKSNRDIVVGLVSETNCLYDFKVWSMKYNCLLNTYQTHRPFGFEVHPRLDIFASVSLDKFNQRVLLTIHDLEYNNITYEVDLNDLAIAQVKLCFIGRDLLYCATRSDWDIYDTTYMVDLTSMRILYESDIGQMSIVSVDSKHAVYLHGEVIEIETYID